MLKLSRWRSKILILPLGASMFLALAAPSAFSKDSSDKKVGHADKNIQILPFGFMSLTKSTPDNSAPSMSESLELDQILRADSIWVKREFNWSNWLESQGGAKSRVFLGGFPFVSVGGEDEQESGFSKDSIFFFWYFSKKF